MSGGGPDGRINFTVHHDDRGQIDNMWVHEGVTLEVLFDTLQRIIPRRENINHFYICKTTDEDWIITIRNPNNRAEYGDYQSIRMRYTKGRGDPAVYCYFNRDARGDRGHDYLVAELQNTIHETLTHRAAAAAAAAREANRAAGFGAPLVPGAVFHRFAGAAGPMAVDGDGGGGGAAGPAPWGMGAPAARAAPGGAAGPMAVDGDGGGGAAGPAPGAAGWAAFRPGLPAAPPAPGGAAAPAAPAAPAGPAPATRADVRTHPAAVQHARLTNDWGVLDPASLDRNNNNPVTIQIGRIALGGGLKKKTRRKKIKRRKSVK